MNGEWFYAALAIITITASAAVAILAVQHTRKAELESGWHVELWHTHYGFPVSLDFSTSMVAGRDCLCRNYRMIPVDRTISREHILLYGQGGNLWIWNLSTVNPARINGTSITTSQRLQPGERLGLGNSEYLITRIDHRP